MMTMMVFIIADISPLKKSRKLIIFVRSFVCCYLNLLTLLDYRF